MLDFPVKMEKYHPNSGMEDFLQYDPEKKENIAYICCGDDKVRAITDGDYILTTLEPTQDFRRGNQFREPPIGKYPVRLFEHRCTMCNKIIASDYSYPDDKEKPYLQSTCDIIDNKIIAHIKQCFDGT